LITLIACFFLYKNVHFDNKINGTAVAAVAATAAATVEAA
jgi:hypothetical protein